MGTNAVRDKKIKGSELEYWVNYARIWVEKYAPEKDRYTVQKDLPEQYQV